MDKRKRIALSVRSDYQQKLQRLADYQGKTITTVVSDLLKECEPAVDSMLEAFEQLEQGVDGDTVLKNMLDKILPGIDSKLLDLK